MLFPGDTAKLIRDGPVPEGHTAALLIYNTHAKKAVVETDQDLLTKDEYRTHAKDVISAIRDELSTWIAHQCFRRKARKGAYNILDVRWVGKWKIRKNGREIRMRMTLRGFKDKDAESLETFAGTCG